MHLIQKTFFERETIDVARDLLGMILVREIGNIYLSGLIIETEAYCGPDDPASHAYRGQTERNQAMFGPVGHAYVYLSYGTHICLNVVAREQHKSAGGILIRALKPLEGVTIIQQHRRGVPEKFLANGPGKVGQAMKIERAHNGSNLTKQGELYLLKNPNIQSIEYHSTPRIGISTNKDVLWRFVATNL